LPEIGCVRLGGRFNTTRPRRATAHLAAVEPLRRARSKRQRSPDYHQKKSERPPRSALL